jgi:cell division initiation protein
MKTTSSEIRNRTFRKSVRGYDRRDVESFLELIASEWEALGAERSSLEQRAVELESQVREFRAIEKGFQQTILQAQEAGGRAVESAKREGHLIIREAEQKAAQIIEKSRNDLMLLKEQVTILAARRDSIASRLKMLLSSELEMIKSIEATEGETRFTAQNDAEMLNEGESERKEIDDIIKSLER